MILSTSANKESWRRRYGMVWDCVSSVVLLNSMSYH